MPTTRLRPKFRIISNKHPDVVLNLISSKLKESGISLEGQVVQEHAFIRFPKERQQYWTPELHVWVREQDGETIIYGVMGPKPKIWTMFMFFYVGILTSAFFGGSYGVIQMSLGMDAPFLWSIPLGILGLVFVYGAAQYGQYKGKYQMEILKQFLEETID
ncbi:MAG: hypothetical protein JW731_11935 [Bacteroidales bacterium]|nr:hypothetical protein [Bacteroidales bacterium]